MDKIPIPKAQLAVYYKKVEELEQLKDDLSKLVDVLKDKDASLADMPHWEARFGYGYAYRKIEEILGKKIVENHDEPAVDDTELPREVW